MIIGNLIKIINYKLKINTMNEEQIEKIRHSLSHLMSMAVLEKFPGAGLGVGPMIEDGFYQDYDLPESINEEIFPELEKRVKELIAEDIKFEHHNMSFEDALEFYKDDPYKTELINDLREAGEKEVSFFKSGSYDNLCKGPHVASTKEIDPDGFKLTKVAGAYWRGDEKNKMLTRIYGVAFENKKKLDEYLKMMKEAEKRDHRVLGEQLDLFMIDEEVGQGLALFLPKGSWLLYIVREFAFKAYLDRGYEPVFTPHIASEKLWNHSGHLDFYAEGMYNSFGIEDEQYRLKPMNCPLHVKMYKRRKRSYRDLPFRWTEMGTVYRYERSGTLHGLTRVRGFTQDDAHIICTPEQLHDELLAATDLTKYILNTFGFKDFEVNLSTRDPKNKDKFIGEDAMWDQAEQELENVIKESGFKKYKKDVGEAVFYGPKIDIKVRDVLNREWQLTTIQFDFNLPTRFGMTYVGADSKEHTPYMIHRALLGSLERFIGVLIEHYAGAFPLWLSPVQIAIMPVGSDHKEYAHKLAEQLKENDFRVEVDDLNETIGNKIRKAEKEKVPYMLVVGDKEMQGDILNVRKRGEKKVQEMKVEEFMAQIKDEEEKRA